jgi:hypothetical protein
MEKRLEEDSVLSMAKDVESEFWADEREREMYFQHQQLLMDATATNTPMKFCCGKREKLRS